MHAIGILNKNGAERQEKKGRTPEHIRQDQEKKLSVSQNHATRSASHKLTQDPKIRRSLFRY